jgi:hypothetical protein
MKINSSVQNCCLLLSAVLQLTCGERSGFWLVAPSIVPLFVMFVEHHFDAIFLNGYPLRCSALIYTDARCCTVFLSTIAGTLIFCGLFLCRLVWNIVANYRRRKAYTRFPVRQLSQAQHYVFNEVRRFLGYSRWPSLNPRNQYVLDPTLGSQPFTLAQVATFMLHHKEDKILWLDFGNFYLGSNPFANWKPLLAWQFIHDNNKEMVSLFSRDAVDEHDNTTWSAIDQLMSMGTTSANFVLCTFVVERKLFTAKGLQRFLQQSPNLTTLAFCVVFLDAECCRLLGDTSRSPFTLSFMLCKLENLGALGDGMRQNGGPTELTIFGPRFFNSSLGSLETNTKLEVLIMTCFPCFNEEGMEAFLLALSAQCLRRVEFDTPNGGLGFEPSAWARLWSFLSNHPSITTVSFSGIGEFAVKPIEDAFASNFTITKLEVTPAESSDESAAYWNEHINSCLKRNRKLAHFTIVYRLVRENVQSLVNGEWDVDRAADLTDRSVGFNIALRDKVY